MADQKAPNSAAEKDKAEGERQPGNQAGEDVRNQYDDETGGDAGISNRPIEEEIANQDALPERGEEKGKG
jgi:hypothetical protein